MDPMSRRIWFKTILAVAMCLLGAVAQGFAQGCAMCYTSAAAAGKTATHALNLGIIVLLLPSLLLFLGVLAFTFYRGTSSQ